jgi:cyclophilin family peptidyl-prolyl cis-trans isomerase
MSVSKVISRLVFFYRRYGHGPARRRLTACAAFAIVLAPAQPALATVVMMETVMGNINIGLYDADAPGTVTNFLKYVGRGDTSNGGYNGTFIHRSEPGFVIQGGGLFCPFPTSPSCHIATDSQIPNEYSATHPNSHGTISMALTFDQSGNVIPDSATSEWFINLADNSARLVGYTVFGRVLDSGMDVVDEIAALPRTQLFFSPFQAPTFYGAFVFINRICINSDVDGACPETEDLAPGGDGDGDGIADRDQPNVTTILTTLGHTATFSSDIAMRLESVRSIDTNTAVSWLVTFTPPPSQSAHFNNGIFALKMSGVMGATGHIVTLHDGSGERPTHYYAYGPTPGNPAPHWYDFMFDGVTGAEIKSDRIILHFVDGMRGDDDLTVNDSLTHTGAQAMVTTVDDGSAQGGGCSIVGIPQDATRSGDWIVVSLFLAMLALVRRAARRQVQRERVINIASP